MGECPLIVNICVLFTDSVSQDLGITPPKYNRYKRPMHGESKYRNLNLHE